MGLATRRRKRTPAFAPTDVRVTLVRKLTDGHGNAGYLNNLTSGNVLGRVPASPGGDPFPRRALVVLILLAAAAAAYVFVPMSGTALSVYYDLIAIGAMLVALQGVAHHRPSRRRGWLSVSYTHLRAHETDSYLV